MKKYRLDFTIKYGQNDLKRMMNYLKKINYRISFNLNEDRLSGVLKVDKPLDERVSFLIETAPHIKSFIELE